MKTSRALLAICTVAAGFTLAWWWPKWFRPKPKAKPEVAIQDGKTIDFSSGQPQVKESPEEKAAIAAAVKEMEEASKGIKFGPTKTLPPPPPPAPPPPSATTPEKK